MKNKPDHSPLVSVIIPAYNQGMWLPFALESVFNQSYRRYEVIVVNDGSTDETGWILAGYGERIRVITQLNSGLSAARNSGLCAAHGEMIAFLDSDDLWYPEMLSATVSYLKGNPDIDLVCGAWDFIDETGQTIQPAGKPSRLQSSVDADFLRTIVLGNLFPVHAVLLRRGCLKCCSLFDTSLKAMEDWDLWLRLASYGYKVGFIDTPVAMYRRHSNCMTLDLPRMEQSFQQVLAKAFANKEISNRCIDLEIHSLIFQWLQLAQYCKEGGADEYLEKCIQKAEDLFIKAPHNSDLSFRYFPLASRLPYTEHFLTILSASNPSLKPNYLWFMSKKSINRKEYKNALTRLFALLSSHSGWVIQKFFQKIKEN